MNITNITRGCVYTMAATAGRQPVARLHNKTDFIFLSLLDFLNFNKLLLMMSHCSCGCLKNKIKHHRHSHFGGSHRCDQEDCGKEGVGLCVLMNLHCQKNFNCRRCCRCRLLFPDTIDSNLQPDHD